MVQCHVWVRLILFSNEQSTALSSLCCLAPGLAELLMLWTRQTFMDQVLELCDSVATMARDTEIRAQKLAVASCTQRRRLFIYIFFIYIYIFLYPISCSAARSRLDSSGETGKPGEFLEQSQRDPRHGAAVAAFPPAPLGCCADGPKHPRHSISHQELQKQEDIPVPYSWVLAPALAAHGVRPWQK